jgi:ABC-2 type transport system permease protein
MSAHAPLLPSRTPHAAFGRILESEAKLAWRAPLGLALGLAIPVLTLVIMGNVPAMNTPAEALGGLTYFNLYFPILIAVAIVTLSLVSLPTHLASYREQGFLRRMSTTPVPPAWMLAAQVIINLAMAGVSLAIIVVVGTVGFGLGAPADPVGFTLALVLTVSSMFAVGVWICAIARSAVAANTIGQLLLYPLLFFAGLWVPRQAMTPVLRSIGDWTPLAAGVQALQDSMLGTVPPARSLLVMLGHTVLFAVLAIRFFRWE